jgi:RNA polymerase sigma-70 factor (ECF subfamily)
VHAIARYKMIDLLRQRGRTSALHDPLDEELEVFAACDTDASDARRDLATVLASLTERQRQVVLMMKIEGASVAETARATGMSESAVKTGLHRSLKALAARFRGGT